MESKREQWIRAGVSALLASAVLLCGCEKREGIDADANANANADADAVPAGSPDVASAAPRLISEEGRRYIWEIEHQVNLLKEHGFASLQEAIVDRDGEKLRALLADDFAGEVPSAAPVSAMDADGFSVSVWDVDAARGGQMLTAGKFADWLMAAIGDLEESVPLRASSHVIALSPDIPAEPGGKWSGTGKLEIWQGSDGAAALAEIVVYFGMKMAGLSEERLQKPGWLSSIRVTKVRSGRSRQALMREVSASRGFITASLWDNWKVPKDKRIANTGGIYMNDFNQDGHHDVFVTDSLRSWFYVGQPGGTFVESSELLEIRSAAGGGFAAFVDLDGDGWEDLIHGIAHHPQGYRVYRNLGGHFFEDVTSLSNLPELLFGEMQAAGSLSDVQVKPTGISIADYDLDGRIDLYVTRGAGGSFKVGSWIDGKAGKVSHNQLLRNIGGWQLQDVTNGAPLDGGNRSTSNAVWLHANADLRPDLYVIDEFGDGLLLLNQADGSFTGRELNAQPTDFGSMGLTTGDINNDGLADVYVAEMYSKAGERVMGNIPPGTYSADVTHKLKRLVDGSQMYVGTGGDGTFRAVGQEMGVHAVGWAWGPCLADLNNDGWLDLYATAGFISQSRDKPDG